MAEIATVAGVAITIPGILSGTWTVLKAAYGLYGSVDIRRTQIQVLLDRCSDFIVKIASHPSAQDATLSPALKGGINEFGRTCENILLMLKGYKAKGFLWCMMHQDKIDSQIKTIEYRMTDAFEIFTFIAHAERDRFQQDMQYARQQDYDELAIKLEQLSVNDQSILDAIRGQNGAQRRIEDLLVAVLKHVEGLGATEQTPEDKFLRSAGTALQRISKGRGPKEVTADWVVSSLEVEFDATDAVGQGSFGRVFKGQWTGTFVAIKQMFNDDAHTLSEADRKEMYGEVKLWTTLHHRNILNLYGACLEATLPFLVMEFCPFGNICDYLRAHPDANRIDLAYDVVAGMTYLHSRGIIHADLKGANVLVSDSHAALVGDFGLSLAIEGIRSRSASSTHAGGPRGTLRWMAPECLDGDPVTKNSDVYSLGMTIWELFSGGIPFMGISERALTRVVVDKKRRPSRPSHLLNDQIWALVQRCWAPEPASRPSMSAVQRLFQPHTSRLGPQPAMSALSTSDSSGSSSIESLPDQSPSPVSSAASQLESEWAQLLRSYPPTWTRGNPHSFINALTIPKPPTRQAFQYRVVKGDTDLGVQPTYMRNADGSQSINLLEYNAGYGIADTVPIKVYAMDSNEEGGAEGENRVLVAQWE